jgi:catechol 2,3-dioxygenase-like lactoylglutathione lyase family enzyme
MVNVSNATRRFVMSERIRNAGTDFPFARLAAHMRDFRDSKSMAKALREALAERNLSLTQSESLELISRLFGLSNWNVLSARIESADRAHIMAGMPEKPGADAPRTQAISPFFIVSDIRRTIAFYGLRLGFSLGFQNDENDLYFAIIYRDGAQIFIKAEAGITPAPNNTRHKHLRWDAYVYAPDPDALHANFQARGASFSEPLKDTHDGLRGFEVTDPDGYILFFGRPR